MKTKFLFTLFFTSALFAANQGSVDYKLLAHVVASGGSPIPIAYSASNSQSRIVNGLDAYGLSHLKIVCSTGPCDASMDLEVSTKYDSTAPPIGSTDVNIFRAKVLGEIDDGPRIGGSIYIRSLTGAPITTGSYDFIGW